MGHMRGWRVEVVVPHVDKCGAVEAVKDGQWDTPWFLDPQRAFFKRDFTGSLGIRLGCNDTKCSGAIVFHGVAVAAEEWLASPQLVAVKAATS